MTTFAASASSREPGFAPADDLDRLELSVARRADELNDRFGARGRDLQHWLQAEHEVIASCTMTQAANAGTR